MYGCDNFHPTYDVDLSTGNVYIRGIVLWLGKLWFMILPCGHLQADTNQFTYPKKGSLEYDTLMHKLKYM